MEAAGYEPPEIVGIAEAEETDRLHLRLVLDIDPLHRPHVERTAVAVDERADEAALVEEVHLLRRCVDVVDVARDRKSKRLNSVPNAHLVCRLLLETKKQ